MLSAANIDVPDQMQGQDISDLYIKPDETIPTWRKIVFHEFYGWNEPLISSNVAYMTKKEKFIFWPGYDYAQVFNLEKDPWEEYDLAPNFNASTITKKWKTLKKLYKKALGSTKPLEHVPNWFDGSESRPNWKQN
mmetsp:Transcript_13151/g.18830  ORF Transcript_13151/g.18830 Transcript_13151/m.18830 type:complete len:135 (+) Transcript_13151:991-1395(+)